MRRSCWVLLVIMMGGSVACATSVRPKDRECPVCGKVSVTTVLMSYSQFGEPSPAVSLLPSPFLFEWGNVDVCPHDLYASWQDRWDEVDDAEKARLRDLLKEPAVRLTEAEVKIIDGHLDELRATPWWEMLWARTCDAARKPDARHAWYAAMKLDTGAYHEGQAWQKALARHFREQAIIALDEARRADWASAVEKRAFRYVRAELIRRAGRAEEARRVFCEVIEAEAKEAANEETEWIGRWAAEQVERIDAAGLPTEELGKRLLPEMPDPWRDEERTGAEWWRHVTALEELLGRAVGGEGAAAEVLWGTFGRKAARLLAAQETLRRSARPDDLPRLRGVDAKWASWFDEIGAAVKAERLSAIGLAGDKNATRVCNLLGDFAKPGPGSAVWRKEVLGPAVERALQGDGLPDVGGVEVDLAWEISELMDVRPADDHGTIGRVLVRVLKRAPHEGKKPDYSLSRAAWELAELKNARNELAKELGGKWRSGFWQVVCEYVAGVAGSGPKLAAHPAVRKDFGSHYGREYEDLAFRLFTEQVDPLWKDKTIRLLRTEPWLKDEVLSYAISLRDAEVEEALTARVVKLRAVKKEAELKHMGLYEIEEIERARLKRKMEILPAS